MFNFSKWCGVFLFSSIVVAESGIGIPPTTVTASKVGTPTQNVTTQGASTLNQTDPKKSQGTERLTDTGTGKSTTTLPQSPAHTENQTVTTFPQTESPVGVSDPSQNLDKVTHRKTKSLNQYKKDDERKAE